ncbi:alpha/beta fold hydrolase [Allobranchiibius sp. GilTou38]|uniref:alpha/beta hydrolase n=1 Tax=Allobranchiibius sp. GilTou38 TaxID=2815210 RepID=UPI001AA0E056|nr:alpha/beta fold hydrolase [Allobranchiibius sp. GilTou38]MBO1766874.1 alpha/beta fold hydrolase [Allobranchiibius sp. GilTou38]
MQIVPGAEPFTHDAGAVGVLVCHGFTGTPQSMRSLAKRFAAEGFSVRLPRLPGHGTTWQELNRTRWTDWFAEVDAAYAELAATCDQVFVAGLSMGGTLATLVAETHQNDVAGLMLINPAYVMKDRRLLAVPALQHLVPSVAAISGDIKKPGVAEVGYARTPLRALRSQMRMWEQVTRDLPQITQPVILFHSPQDHVVPPACSELFLSRISSEDVTDVVLHDSYHVATLDNDAGLIEDSCVDFITRVADL